MRKKTRTRRAGVLRSIGLLLALLPGLALGFAGSAPAQDSIDLLQDPIDLLQDPIDLLQETTTSEPATTTEPAPIPDPDPIPQPQPEPTPAPPPPPPPPPDESSQPAPSYTPPAATSSAEVSPRKKGKKAKPGKAKPGKAKPEPPAPPRFWHEPREPVFVASGPETATAPPSALPTPLASRPARDVVRLFLVGAVGLGALLLGLAAIPQWAMRPVRASIIVEHWRVQIAATGLSAVFAALIVFVLSTSTF